MEIYFLNREFKVDLPKRVQEPSTPEGKYPAPKPRDEEFKKRPGTTPGYNPNNKNGQGYNPTNFAHGLSESLVGSPSRYGNDPNEFMMYSSM